MDYPITTISSRDYPVLLREIPDPPEKIYLRGALPEHDVACLTVVGSRKYTTYGKQVLETLISGLRGYPVAIISGLALGIDSIAHEAALDAGLYTLAVPGSGLSDGVLYPARHRRLARRILESGGGLLSEFEPDFKATTWSFPARNRIMAGLAHAVLVIEATERSGTLITARLATDYNRDVLAVPGSIFSEHTKGPHMLIRLGAAAVTSSDDILEALDIEPTTALTEALPTDLTETEQRIFDALSEPRERDTLLRMTSIPAPEMNRTLSRMELNGLISIEMQTIRRNS